MIDTINLNDVLSLVAIILTVIGGFWALAKVLVKLLAQHLDSKFAALDGKFADLDSQLDRMERSDTENQKQMSELERDMLRLRAELPNQYVRREDYVRGQTVIESKLDAQANMLQSLQLQQAGVKDK
ncbi:putative phage-like exported protein [Methylophaga frappieri]|uniref:Putative phage-like exported protein n=1 Tax=Methylophaga frappieri (strain ATCC BAA-2434 / DSM 25690 / JAM7) TaxID=754477 RepID=I1YGF3_METFJ|nr:hypothetical protein [Methylophaga frappieri]AFJ01996.1 putative phage-like exported protein [Methylophaga frappieri]